MANQLHGFRAGLRRSAEQESKNQPGKKVTGDEQVKAECVKNLGFFQLQLEKQSSKTQKSSSESQARLSEFGG